MRCVVLYSKRNLVSISRLFIAAHFPHQVTAGGISGDQASKLHELSKISPQVNESPCNTSPAGASCELL
uniref:Uncharacterized protein n=1 Tax=Romanomermis culicivorax TaxID=13658 RepID=A0A915IXN7_ROMCU